jgi:ERCC4-related helicase
MTRYARMMNEVIKKGVKTKLLMLSATPVNNRMNDLKNQISFITEGDDSVFEEEGIDNISNVMKLAQRQFSDWAKYSVRNINELFDRLDNRYFKLLDMLTIARSRKHIVKYYDSADVGRFPTRLRPINEKTDIDSEQLFPSLRNINNAIRKLNLANFSPISSLKEEKKAEYAAKYDYQLSTGSVFKQSDREKNLVDLMRVNYLKRMESSIYSFYLSIKALLEQVNDNLHKIEHITELSDSSVTIDNIDIEDDESDYLIGNKVKVLLQDIDLVKWRQELEYDRDTLTKLMESAATISTTRDEKLTRLKEVIAHKIENPLNDNNKKVIVFTAFADTATYLYKELSEWILKEYGLYAALIKGSGINKTNFPGIERKEMNELLMHFSPFSKERHKTFPHAKGEIDLLIATDCISEGQNLQDCDYLINYDIHWNPVRVIQRFGRIDRIGSINPSVQLINFWPTQDLDKYITLKNRVEARMALVDIAATNEDNLLSTEDLQDLIKDDLKYRDKQLKRLREEVLDLEDFNESVSLTDFTLDDFRTELSRYLEANRKLLQESPLGLYAVVPSDPQYPIIQPGVIFCLKQKGDTSGSETVNPLQPYFLVYVLEDGTVRLGFAQPKQILEIYRALCVGKNSPLETLCTQFNHATQNGKDVSHYSELLENAVTWIDKSFKKRAVSSLFTDRSALLIEKAKQISQTTDFDLITWLIIC